MRRATVFTVHDNCAEVVTAGLVMGDGVDLVVRRPGRRSLTVQLSVGSAMELSRCLVAAARESEQDERRQGAQT